MAKLPVFCTGYEPGEDRDARSNAAGFKCVGDSLTVQADAVDADINVIMDRYARTGQIPGVSRLPSFGDFEGLTDYGSMLRAIREADDLFMQMPAKIRAEFDNDPERFIAACEVPENREKFADLGLLSKEVTHEINQARVKRLQEAEKAAEARGAAAARAGRDRAPGGVRRGSGESEDGA